MPNREMQWIDRDFVSAAPTPTAATAFTPPEVPFAMPGFLRQHNRGLLSTMRYLDFSDTMVSEAPDCAVQDDLGSLIDNANEIDWVSSLAPLLHSAAA